MIAGYFIRVIDKMPVRDNGRLLFHRIAVMLALLILSISFVGTVAASPDVMFRYNANHSGDYSPVAGMTTTSVSQLWNLSIDYEGSTMDSSPVVSNGVVYIGSGDNNLSAVNAASGALLWKYQTGLDIVSSPAVSNGTVYFGDLDGNVYAINASTGTQVWTYNTVSGRIYSSPAIANSTVYISDAWWLYALNAATGAQQWSKQIGNDIYSSPAIANDVVYIGSNDHHLYAIGATNGTSLWDYDTQNWVIAPPSVTNGIVYVGSGTHVFALNASTGTLIWNVIDPNIYANYYTSPAVANGTVYVAGGYEGGYSRTIRALDASTGAYVWNYTANGQINTPSVANGIVYFGCDDHNIYALNASTGALYWKLLTGDVVQDAPSIANGVLYIASQDGKLYALDLSGGAPPVPSVTSVFPSSGPTTGGDMVTITGTGFTGATAIAFGGTSAWPPSSISDTTILVATPAHAAGTVDVTVTTIRGTSATSSADRFTYTSVPLPSAGFIGTPLSGLAPLTVTFTDTSTGTGIISWNWTFGDASAENSTMQNPVHTYLNNGTYSVTLNVTNVSGSNSLTKSNYITVGIKVRVGVYRNGIWYLDYDGNGIWDYQVSDKMYSFGGPGNVSVVGDWNGDRKTEIGVTNGINWYLDDNGNGVWDGTGLGNDKYGYFGISGYTPVVGDWNGDNKTEIGVTNGINWYLDDNGNGVWDGTGTGNDKYGYFGISGYTPVVGDWNGDNKTEIGVTNGVNWYLDDNGNGVWDGTGTGKDKYGYFNVIGYTPVIGDWNGDNKIEIGVTNGINWYLDDNGNGVWDGTGTGNDKYGYFGISGYTPVVGDWNGDKKTEIGVTNDVYWYLDSNGNGVWDGTPTDTAPYFGISGWTPVTGNWH